MHWVTAFIMAGGVGRRLEVLTRNRTKSAIPFGGKFRLIDFTLSNCINSGIRRIFVLTQYKSESLNKHIQEGWSISSAGLGDYIYCVPAQQKTGKDWYLGTADSLRQNIDLITRSAVDDILILSGDHVYKMNYSQMMTYHKMKKADLTVAVTRVKKEEAAGKLGVLEVDHDYRITDFQEKPLQPKVMADAPEYVLASMGIYIFSFNAIKNALQERGHDFAIEILPIMISQGLSVFAYEYEKENRIEDFVVEVKEGLREKVLVNRTRDSSYWKDVGTIDSYYEASMDLVGVDPMFNLYGSLWPFRTYQRSLPPTKYIIGGNAQESIVCDGCIISGGRVLHSILSPGVIVEREALLKESIVFDDVIIEPNTRIRRAIIDKESIIRSGASLGYDHEADKRRGCIISDQGIVVVPKWTEIGAF